MFAHGLLGCLLNIHKHEGVFQIFGAVLNTCNVSFGHLGAHYALL